MKAEDIKVLEKALLILKTAHHPEIDWVRDGLRRISKEEVKNALLTDDNDCFDIDASELSLPEQAQLRMLFSTGKIKIIMHKK